MKEIELCYRQGDVYLFRIDAFPKGERHQDSLTKNCQLALGELSHHNHYFEDALAVDLFKSNGFDGLTFVDVKSDCKLLHGLERGYHGPTTDNDYHSEIIIKTGQYVTGIVQETDWLTKTIRRVID